MVYLSPFAGQGTAASSWSQKMLLQNEGNMRSSPAHRAPGSGIMDSSSRPDLGEKSGEMRQI